MSQAATTREAWKAESVDNYDPTSYDPRLYETAVEHPADLGSLGSIDDEAMRQYHRAGFLSIDPVFSPEVIAGATAGVERLISGDVPSFRGIQWEAGVREHLPGATLAERRDWVRKLIYYVDAEPRLHVLAHDPLLLDVVGRILGGAPVMFADQALLKPPGIGREKPWHQDKAFFDVKPGAPVVGVWIALDPATIANGCMHVIAGSHNDGPVVHFRRRDFQICDTEVQRSRVAAVPVGSGGAMLFDGLLHHGTPANHSEDRRWALQFHYARAEDIWRSKEERHTYKEQRLAVFGAEGKDVTC